LAKLKTVAVAATANAADADIATEALVSSLEVNSWTHAIWFNRLRIRLAERLATTA
jgi:hypothetical protein